MVSRFVVFLIEGVPSLVLLIEKTSESQLNKLTTEPSIGSYRICFLLVHVLYLAHHFTISALPVQE
jgi:hypothetical protein